FSSPYRELAGMVKGRAAPAAIRSVRVDSGAAHLEIEVPLIDPLHRLKTVELRHVRKDALKALPPAGKDGNWPDLLGAEKVAVKIEGGQAIAMVPLKAPEKNVGERDLHTAQRDEDLTIVVTHTV